MQEKIALVNLKKSIRHSYNLEQYTDAALQQIFEGGPDTRLTMSNRSLFEGFLRIGNLALGLIRITPSIANKWLSEFKYKNQRNLRQWRIAILANEIRKGRFLEGTQIHLVETPDGKRWLVNGNHTLNAIVKSGVSVLLSILITKVDNNAMVDNLFCRHDIHLKRTIRDMFTATDMAETLSMTPSQLGYLGAATQLIAADFGDIKAYHRVFDDLQDSILQWAPYANMFFKNVFNCVGDISNQIRRASTMSVALVTFKYAPDKAARFWDAVAHDEGLVGNDPRKALHKYLLTASELAGSHHGGIRRTKSARYVATAWNAYVKGRKMKNIPDPSGGPIHIELSPYKSTEV